MNRIGWIDTARGLAVILIVMLHSYLIARLGGGFPRVIGEINFLLTSIRLPVLFVVSAMLVERLLGKPLPEVMGRRVWPLLWLLAVWTVIGSAVDAFVPLIPDQGQGQPNVFVMLWHPQGNLWFLYALVVYTLMGWVILALRDWSRILALVGFAVLLAVYDQLRDEFFVRNLLQFYSFFMLGLLGRQLVVSLIATSGRTMMVTAIGLLGMVVLRIVELPYLAERMLDAVFGVGFGIALAQLLQNVGPVKFLLDKAGRSSLAIFVGHQPVLAVVAGVVGYTAIDPVLFWLLLLAAGLGGAVAIHWLAQRLGLELLYRIPDAVLAALQRVWGSLRMERAMK